MANVGEQVQGKANSMKNNMMDKAQNLGSSFDKVSHDLGERIGSAAGEVTEIYTDYVESARSYVKANPVQSVLIAAATGVVVGNVLAMMRRH